MITCPLCPGTSFSTVQTLLKHIRITHSDRADFLIQCNLQGCKRTFRNFKSYENHIHTFHDLGALDVESPAASNESELEGGDNIDPGASAVYNSSPEETGELIDVNLSPESQLQRAAATWILKTRECHRIPVSVMDAIISDVQSLFQLALGEMQSRIRSQLEGAGVPELSIQAITRDVGEQSPYGNIFRGLETQHQQLRYFRSNFRLVEPVKIVLGTKRKAKGHGRKRRLVEEDQCMVYVPLLESLEALLQNDAILAEVERGHQSSDNVLRDFCDGQHFQSHPLFAVHTSSLQLLLYYDDAEVCNPLGSSRTKHKLGLFYYLLGNIRPLYRSKLKVIQLAAICKQRYIKTYGIDAVLEPLVRDLQKLEDSHIFRIHGVPRTFSGTLAILSADNPASCCVGGFKESASALCPCRQCMGKREDMNRKFDEDKFVLRNDSDHLVQCTELEDEDLDYVSKSKEYGVNRRSILLDLRHFSLCSGALVPDVMHDVLEGALPHELKLLLHHCIQERYFHLPLLNDVIERMELGCMEGDRPAPISETNAFKQKASQMWTLGRLFPFMVGEYIPEDDEYWLNYLLMLQITDYLLAPEITEDEVAELKVLIEEHHLAFTQLYPEASVIPKMHYLVHMPRLIQQFGPIVKHWTMRYEARHNYFKKLAQNLGNYINLSWTLAKRHQYLQCYYQLNSDTVADDCTEVGPGDTVAIRDRPSGLQSTTTECYRTRWVKYCGMLYKKPCALLFTVEDDYPQFGELQDLYVVDGNRVVCDIKPYHTTSFLKHYHAFVVQPTRVSKLVCIEHLYNHLPYIVRQVHHDGVSKCIIVPKYHICGTLQE